MELSIIIPSYNEEKIKSVLPSLKNALEKIEYEVLVTDTAGQIDNPAVFCEEDNVAYIKLQGGNQYGDAIRAAINAVQGEFCVIMDEDCFGLTETIPVALSHIRNGYDLSVGSRYTAGGNSGNGKALSLMSKSVNSVSAFTLGIKVKDIFSRFRIYKTQMLKNLTLVCKGFDITQEIIVKLDLYNENLRVIEVPVSFSQKLYDNLEKREPVKTACSQFKSLFRLKKLQKRTRFEKMQQLKEEEINLLADKELAEKENQKNNPKETKQIVTDKAVKNIKPSRRKRIALSILLAAAFVLFFFAGSGVYSAILSKYETRQYFTAGADYWTTMTPGVEYSKTLHFESNVEKENKPETTKVFIKELELYFSNIDQRKEGTLIIELIDLSSGEVLRTIVIASGQIHGQDIFSVKTDILVPVNSSAYTDIKVTARSDCESLAVTCAEGSLALSVVTIPSGIYSKSILIAALCIIGLPLLVWGLFKLKIINFKRVNSKKVSIFDIIFGVALLFGAFLIFSFDDIDATAQHGFLLAKLIFEGKGFQFFDYASSVGIGATYGIVLYLIFAVWNSPFVILEKIMGKDIFSSSFFREMPFVMAYWNKLLSVLFFFAMAHVIYKICRQLKMGPEKAKWAAFAWSVYPLTFFSGFIYAQCDSIGLFFLMCAILALLKNKSLLFSFLFGIAFCMKSYVILAYIPLLLLKHKKLSAIGINFIFFIALNLLLSALFAQSYYIKGNDVYIKQILATLTENGVAGPFGTVSFVLAAFAFASIFAYKYKPSSLLQLDRMIIYLPLFVFAMFFSSASWNAAYWYILLTPFLLIAIFQAEKSLVNTMLLLLLVIGFSGTYICGGHPVCFNEIQLHYGIFKQMFVGGNPYALKLSDIYTWFGLIPASVYPTLLVAVLVAFTVLLFPKQKNIGSYALGLKQNLMSVTRETAWISPLLFSAIYIIPCILFYFTI